MIVADTNLLIYLYVPSTRTSQAEIVLERDPLWIAPLLWRSEFRNTLMGLIRQGTLSLDTTLQIARQAEVWMLGREYSVVTDHVLRLASQSGCSAYDCEFAALAEDQELRLVTADRQILKAFPSIAIAIDQFIE